MTAERRNPWPMRVAVGGLAVWFVALIALTRWGPDEVRCVLSILVAPQETEQFCAQAYPDTWRKEPSP